jgi:hypothetical protein
MSLARNARDIADVLALLIGLVIAPLLAYYKVELDVLWSGLVGGTIAFLVWRFHRRPA